MRVTTSWYRQPDDEEFEVTAEVSPLVPARISGPPELCHPAEGGDVEIIRVVRPARGKVCPTLDPSPAHTDWCSLSHRQSEDLESFTDSEVVDMEERSFEALAETDEGPDYDREDGDR